MKHFKQKILLVGLGVQGNKRSKLIKHSTFLTVDPINCEADYKNVKDVPLNLFDIAILCIPDDPKYDLCKYLLENKKNILVEKPLLCSEDKLHKLKKLCEKNNLYLYTAYNHRFEPHFVKMKNIISSGFLGKIYNVSFFYGNGTSKLVKNSIWRDKGAGVLPDLGSHLLDTFNYWFNKKITNLELFSVNRFENNSPDHISFGLNGKIRSYFEVSLLSWRNHFTVDIIGSEGSAHIKSLCKWGPSELITRKRVFPSGRPTENSEILTQADPTWQLEYDFFINECKTKTYSRKIDTDIWINKEISKLSQKILLQGNSYA